MDRLPLPVVQRNRGTVGHAELPTNLLGGRGWRLLPCSLWNGLLHRETHPVQGDTDTRHFGRELILLAELLLDICLTPDVVLGSGGFLQSLSVPSECELQS